jgi:hypothetical protein
VSDTDRERRWRWYWVSEEAIWGLFSKRFKPHRFFWVYHVTSIPDDAVLVDIHHDPLRRVFGFRFCHQSFAVVPDGDFTPDAGPLEHERTRLEVIPDPDSPAEGSPNYGWAMLLPALRAENDRLRGIFGDLCEDDARLKAAREQGAAEERQRWHKACREQIDRVKRRETDMMRTDAAIGAIERVVGAAHEYPTSS